MTEFILASENLPFAIALGLMFAIALFEGVTTLLGFGASSLIESLLPEMDVDVDFDIDAGPDLGDVGSAGALSRLLGWFNIGRMPVLVLFILFLLGFGLTGLIIQFVAQNMTGRAIPAFLASLPAFAFAITDVKILGAAMAKVMPREETEAVSENSFIGRIAVITLGTAKKGQPAQARVRDQHGQIHYLMVEPDSEEHVFEAGSEVLLVMQAGAVFHAIPSPEGALSEQARQLEKSPFQGAGMFAGVGCSNLEICVDYTFGVCYHPANFWKKFQGGDVMSDS